MKRKVAILTMLSLYTTSITNVLNCKISDIEQTNKNLMQQKIKIKNQVFLDLEPEDFISTENTNFKDCVIEFWFDPPGSLKKKLSIGYSAWTYYFYPMIQKLDEYIFRHVVSTTIAGEIKIGLINMFAKIIKNKFTIGGNDADKNPPYWDGYQIAASYMIKNKEHLNIFFRNKKVDSFFNIAYWDNSPFLNSEQLEALKTDSSENVRISEIQKFNIPSWFPILKHEVWDIDQDLFSDDKTNISSGTIDDKNIVEFVFGIDTIDKLKRSLDKYSAIDQIPYYSGWMALSFCTMLKEKILEYFKIDETFALQFATYIYKYRSEIRTWKASKAAYIEEDHYWFEEAMEQVYEKSGKNFDSFNVLSAWPI